MPRTWWWLGLGLVALAAGGCTDRCKKGTVFVSYTLPAAAANAQTIDVTVAIGGEAARTMSIARQTHGTSGSIEIDFGAYPSGKALDVTLTARTGAETIASSSQATSASPGCTALSFTLAPLGNTPGADGGTDLATTDMVLVTTPTCAGSATDAPAQTLDFSNNLIASPAPPGNLAPQNAPQIVELGWDDIESANAMQFLNQLLASVTNPNGVKAGCTLNTTECYGQGFSDTTKYACGDATLASNRALVTTAGFEVANKTIDNLEAISSWSGIPNQYKDPTTNGWKQTPDGLGAGVLLDQSTWQTVIKAADTAIKGIYSVGAIQGFRAPRFEINDLGLKALAAVGYTYDASLDEKMPDGYVDAAIAIDTPGQKGFNWSAWPHTLDNGSPSVWQQQATGDKAWVTDYPNGLWEIPIDQVYVPSKDGLGTTIANTMLKADNPQSCTFPDGIPADQRKHCFLAEGELKAGDSIKSMRASNFNTFVYSRMTEAQWLTVMKHTFLLHYYGNRAPLTYGGPSLEFTDPYDSYVLAVQTNMFGYRDVPMFNKYPDRQAALLAFVQWIRNDPTFSKDTFFMSAKQLVDYMKHPVDKNGAAATADTVAAPDSNGMFTRLAWKGQGATINVVDGNKADIVFNVASATAAPAIVAAGLAPGSLANVSHIDIKYSTEVPFRVRLLTSDGSPSMTVLLAGVGGDRLARIRVKDFFPGRETAAAQVATAALVDGAYLAKVTGIAFESAATPVTGAKSFNTHIEQITLHGVSTTALCAQ